MTSRGTALCKHERLASANLLGIDDTNFDAVKHTTIWEHQRPTVDADGGKSSISIPSSVQAKQSLRVPCVSTHDLDLGYAQDR
jgi:hypothetical protein